MTSPTPAPAVSMRDVVKAGFSEAAVLVLGGVFTGAIGGFWSLGGDGVADIARTGARPYLALLAVLPALLVLMNLNPPKLDYFATLRRALVMGLLAGGIGGLVAALAYFVPSGNLPSFLKGEDAGDMYTALRGEVGLARFLAVVVVSTVAGLIVGVLTHYRVRAYRANRG